MKSYTILVPTTYNDGAAVPDTVTMNLENRMLRRFGGFTHNPTLLRGAWLADDGTLYRDTLTSYILFTEHAQTVFDFARIVAQDLEQVCVSVIAGDGTATLVYARGLDAVAA